MPTTNLGRVAIVPQGAYNPATTYKKLDLVTGVGDSYMYINPTPAADVPLTDTTHWQQIAEKGDTFNIGGEWAVGTEYKFWDTVLHGGSSYVYINPEPSTGNEPPNATYWQLLAQGAEAYTDPSLLDWDDIQRVVRLGDTDKIFVVGDQLQTTHSAYTSIVWDVVGITDVDHTGFDPADSAYFTKYPDAKPMLLHMHRVIHDRQFDNIEALYYAESELATGTYHFSFNSIDYELTLAVAIPAGGQLTLSGFTEYVPSTFTTYASGTSTTVIDTGAVTTGTDGTDLGTADGTTLNHYARVRYGNNNFEQSAVRQWLNSALGAGLWWTPQTIFDRPPSYANIAGFLNGLDPAFVAVLGETDHITVNNTVTDGGGVEETRSYVTRDKIYLPSRTEIYGTHENALAPEGEQYPLYVGSDDADKIKYDIDSQVTARNWWMRSPGVSSAADARVVITSGALYSSGSAGSGGGAAAACVIL